MSEQELDFDLYYDIVVELCYQKGILHIDSDTVRADYEMGMSAEDSAKEFIDELSD